jgi:predicted nucleic acid-binding Zn ribbon protein
MAAGVYNFKVEQGVGYTFSVIYKDKDNNVIPLTDYLATGKMKLKMSDPTPIATFNCSVIGAEGKVVIQLAHDALTNLPLKGNKFNDYIEAVYDIILEKSGEDPAPIRLLNGTVQISPKVT